MVAALVAAVRSRSFYASSLNFGGVYDVAGGTGGEYGDAQYGQDGGVGTYYEQQMMQTALCADLLTTEAYGAHPTVLDLI